MEIIKDYFINNIGEKRWEHSLRVLDIARRLGQIYDVDRGRLTKAALLHDCAKFTDKGKLLKKAQSFGIIVDRIMLNNLELIHGPLGAKIAQKEFAIEDPTILEAIEFHTTGRQNMGILEKIIFIADFIEPERSFMGVEEVRNLAYKDLDMAIVLAIDLTLEFLISKDKLISLNAIEARNDLKLKIWERKEAIYGDNR